MSFDIKFTRFDFAWQASRCQQAFSKPRLVNLISKDTHQVFSMYRNVLISMRKSFRIQRVNHKTVFTFISLPGFDEVLSKVSDESIRASNFKRLNDMNHTWCPTTLAIA